MRTKRAYLLISIFVAASLLLAACGGDAATPTSVPAAATNTSAPAAATDTTAPAAATNTSAPTGGGVPAGKIAILLPETKTARYETQDLPNFKAELQAKGFDLNNLIYSNANQDASAQQQQAEAAITNGAKVLVLDPVGTRAAAQARVLDLEARGQPIDQRDVLDRRARLVLKIVFNSDNLV